MQEPSGLPVCDVPSTSIDSTAASPLLYAASSGGLAMAQVNGCVRLCRHGDGDGRGDSALPEEHRARGDRPQGQPEPAGAGGAPARAQHARRGQPPAGLPPGLLPAGAAFLLSTCRQHSSTCIAVPARAFGKSGLRLMLPGLPTVLSASQCTLCLDRMPCWRL